MMKRSGLELYGEISLSGQKGEDMSHVNAHQSTSSAEENYKNQMDRKTHSLDTGQPVPPVHPVIAQRAHEQSGHGDRDGGYAWAQQHEFLLTEATLALASAVCPV